MKLQLSLDDARSQADQLIAALAPACARIAIAGSIRRQAKYIGDVEIVAIPHYDIERDLFGRPFATRSQLDTLLNQLILNTQLLLGDKNGPRYKKFTLPRFNLQLDLFITDPDRWGVIHTLRTGSADFSRWLVTHWARGGALPNTMRIRDGRLWEFRNQPIPTPTERDLFDAITLPWVPPPARTKGHWRQR